MYNLQSLRRDPRVLAMSLAGALALAVGIPATSAAQPRTAETIGISWGITSPPPTSSPFRGSGVGTFTATNTITDSGTLSATAQDVAVPSPNHGTVQLVFVLTSDTGGTLTLRCRQTATDFSDLTAVPGSGTCAIIGGAGLWAGIHGQGTISALTNVNARTETATIDLNTV